jgi:hypothetical protein
MPELSPPWKLRNGGEMGDLIRAFDWSRTPLGPLQQWPQHLRTPGGWRFDHPLTKPLDPARLVALLAELELPG